MSRALPLLALLAACRIHFDPVADAGALEYSATVAECVEPSMPDPAACRSLNGSDQLVIDLQDAKTDKPWHSFVRFEIDSRVAQHTIESVVLRVAATDAVNAPGPASGEVWSVGPFDATTLVGAEPAQLAMLAPDQGSVMKLQVVEWSLPTSTVSAAGPVFLGLFPTKSDGVNYWNDDGRDPPRLIVNVK